MPVAPAVTRASAPPPTATSAHGQDEEAPAVMRAPRTTLDRAGGGSRNLPFLRLQLVSVERIQNTMRGSNTLFGSHIGRRSTGCVVGDS